MRLSSAAIINYIFYLSSHKKMEKYVITGGIVGFVTVCAGVLYYKLSRSKPHRLAESTVRKILQRTKVQYASALERVYKNVRGAKEQLKYSAEFIQATTSDCIEFLSIHVVS